MALLACGILNPSGRKIASQGPSLYRIILIVDTSIEHQLGFSNRQESVNFWGLEGSPETGFCPVVRGRFLSCFRGISPQLDPVSEMWDEFFLAKSGMLFVTSFMRHNLWSPPWFF
jgi:hypothetical protein